MLWIIVKYTMKIHKIDKNRAQFCSQHSRQLLRTNLCYLERESKDNITIKIADFTIIKEIAMDYMKKRHPGYHMRPSRWKDIKISVHI